MHVLHVNCVWKRMCYTHHFLSLQEVLGAVVSVLIIWVITGALFYKAVQRVIDPKIEAGIMLITSCIGVYVNIL